jgi:cytochrome b6-f complex iron-sulfur subunit/menaquinol-cytochrome c reductase iron-sulfur subunit
MRKKMTRKLMNGARAKNIFDMRAGEPESPQRRSFLGVITTLIGAAITALLGGTIGRYAIAPALSTSDASEWTDVGLLEEIPDGRPVKRSVVVSQDSGWGRFNSQRLVWVIRKGPQITVFSASCPHLGCTINVAASGFICPCHGSAWGPKGEKAGGPTPRGMDSLDHRVDGDLLKVKYQYFKEGVTSKEPVS